MTQCSGARTHTASATAVAWLYVLLALATTAYATLVAIGSVDELDTADAANRIQFPISVAMTTLSAAAVLAFARSGALLAGRRPKPWPWTLGCIAGLLPLLTFSGWASDSVGAPPASGWLVGLVATGALISVGWFSAHR
jgi:hypothetical protein